MADKLSRRDFLKLASLVPGTYLMPRTNFLGNATHQKFVILLFDAWSAKNISLYGYPRKTTPNLEKLAEKAIVYHNHYAAGYYTYPSTASLLTGVLPWTHRGQMPDESSTLKDEFLSRNIFTLFDTHQRFAISHNILADDILNRMAGSIDHHQSNLELSLSKSSWFEKLFRDDLDSSVIGWTRSLDISDDGYAHALFLSRIQDLMRTTRNARLKSDYPRGLPIMYGTVDYILEPSIDWAIDHIKDLQAPSLSYIHYLPPHDPYCTRRDFYNKFLNDGFDPVQKPYHIMAQPDVTHEDQRKFRQEYDEYILFVDSEIGRIMADLEKDGTLDDTWIILTSDHGEMFERGIPNHFMPSFHQPLIHIPLMIFPPGQKHRIDIYDPTSTIDLLPTMLELSGKSAPIWLEGQPLPPFGPSIPTSRSLYSVDGRHSPKEGPYTNGGIVLLKNNYKMIYLFGHVGKYSSLEGHPYFELYNLKEDPEELTNLFHPDDQLSKQMIEEIMEKMAEMGCL